MVLEVRVRVRPLLSAAVVLAVVPQVFAGKDTHTYKDNEQVTVWTDKVGPYNNPQETYKYGYLGLCELEGSDIEVQQGENSIGEDLEGHEFYSSPRLNIRFGEDRSETKVCSMTLKAETSDSISQMINDNFWYQLYIDDLPIWAFVGEHSKFAVDMSRLARLAKKSQNASAETVQTKVPEIPHNLKGKPLPRIFLHRHFTLFRNGDQLIEVDMEPSNAWPVYPGAQLDFTYSATWYTTTKPFSDRSQRYLDPKFFEHKVHWFSIVNSFMLCLFLCAVVAIILMKTLKRDFSRISASEAEELESLDCGDESGWKQVGGDVFRPPKHLAMFSVLYATGVHMACTIFCVLIFAMCNSYYASRGATSTSFVVCYLITVIVGGYEGGRVYRMFGGTSWKLTMVKQCLFMPSLVFISFMLINTTAIMYRATMTVPFKTIILILLMFLCLCVPLHTGGTLLGRRASAEPPEKLFPVRVHWIKRPIPAKHWAFTPAMIVTAGLVPFGCLFIEMYFILSAVWSHNKIYYVYGFMMAILLLLCLVVVCVSITCTYVLLNAEDWRWQWQSFICCGSTSIYVFLYTVHYFYNSTQMSGFLQTVYYFGTTLNACIGLGLFCGALGFMGASKFVFLIYSNIKVE